MKLVWQELPKVNIEEHIASMEKQIITLRRALHFSVVITGRTIQQFLWIVFMLLQHIHCQLDQHISFQFNIIGE